MNSSEGASCGGSERTECYSARLVENLTSHGGEDSVVGELWSIVFSTLEFGDVLEAGCGELRSVAGGRFGDDAEFENQDLDRIV